MSTVIYTPRMRLVPLTPGCINTTPDDRHTLAQELGVNVPDNWPVEHYDQDVLDYCRAMLRAGADENVPRAETSAEALPTDDAGRAGPGPNTDWLPRFMILGGTLIGMVGMTPPDESGRTMGGYSVLPQFRRRGLASEAWRSVIEWTFGDPRVTAVRAETYPDLIASIRVLEGSGFRFIGAGDGDGVIRYELTREEWLGVGSRV